MTTATQHLDEHIEAIVNTFGIQPHLIKNITIDHQKMTATVYRTDYTGHKYLNDDGSVATDNLTIPHTAFFRQ